LDPEFTVWRIRTVKGRGERREEFKAVSGAGGGGGEEEEEEEEGKKTDEKNKLKKEE
jgi:hypothetical protein